MHFVDKVVYVNCVEGFAEVEGDYYGAFMWRVFVEALHDLVG
jgi:hypothetical protein